MSKPAVKKRRKKKTSTCAVSALLRTRIDQGAPQLRLLDPTTLGGLASPGKLYWLPAGTPSVRQKDRLIHEHRRGLCGGCCQPHNATLSLTGRTCKGIVPAAAHLRLVRFDEMAYNPSRYVFLAAQNGMRNGMSAVESKALALRSGWLWAIWLVLLSIWTLALVTTYPAQIKQQVLPREASFPASKMLHVSAYAFLAGFAAFLPSRGGWRWLPLVVLSLHGFGTEYWQTFVPMRYGCWSDVAIDHVGILLGSLLTWKWWLPSR